MKGDPMSVALNDCKISSPNNSSIIVHGGVPLCGEVDISGSKHSILHILGALWLLNGEFVVRNVPNIWDVRYFLDIYKSFGMDYILTEQELRLVINPDIFKYSETKMELASKIRSSILLLGSTLVRSKYVKFLAPTGDRIDNRPFAEFFAVLEQFGISYARENGFIEATIKKPLRGDRTIDLYSHGNNRTALAIILAGSNIGKTILLNPLPQPEILELCAFMDKFVCPVEVTFRSNDVLQITIDGSITERKYNDNLFIIGPDKCEMGFRVRGGYIPGKFIFPDNILRNFVLDMATMGVKGLRFCGEGENMLHPKFLETLMLAKVVGLRTFIITNGTMLKSGFHVVARCTDYLRVSFNALTPESYCRVHGISNKETYFQILNGLKNVRIEKNALNNQLPIISMSCVIIKDNIDEALDGCLVQNLQNVCLDFIVLKSDRLWDMTPSDKGKYFEIIKHFQDASIRVADYSGYSSPITIATRDWEEKLGLGCAVRFMRANVDRFDVHSCVTRHDIYGIITQQRLPMIWSSNQRIVLQRQRAKSKLANCDRCFWGDFHRIMNFLFEQEMTESK